MANVQHSTLTGADLHEPKGADSATVGQVYVANGSGGGTWTTIPQGWGYYSDGLSTATQVFNTTAAKLQIDGLGATTEESYLPRAIRGSDSLWDTANDKITPIAVGDSYELRLDLEITATSGSPGYLELQLDIGGGATPSTVIVDKAISVYKSAPFELSVGFPIFCLSTFNTNGGQIFLNADSGTITVGERAILISRISGDI